VSAAWHHPNAGAGAYGLPRSPLTAPSHSNPFIMNTRIVSAFLLLVLLAPPALAQRGPAPPVLTQEAQAALTPDAALERLRAGNERFATNTLYERDYPAEVAGTAAGQYPFAVVLTCMDSRTPPELVFDQGLGDVFSIRVAGNYADTDVIGGMEFATAVAGAKLIVVMGHTECGAVKGACDHVELGNLTHTLSNLAPAVYATTDVEGPRTSANKAFVNAVAHMNVRMTVEDILERSPIIRGLVEEGNVRVVGAMRDVATERVTFFEDLSEADGL
jgi:carbonic anhydrase